MIELGQPQVSPSYRRDEAGTLRVIAKAVTFGDKAHAAFTDIGRLAENLQFLSSLQSMAGRRASAVSHGEED